MNSFLVFTPMIAITLLMIACINYNYIDEHLGFTQLVNMTKIAESNQTNSPSTSGNIFSILSTTPGQSIHIRGLEATEEQTYLKFFTSWNEGTNN